MTAMPPEIPFLSTVSFMLTYHCTIACPHCIVDAGPNRKESMPLDSAIAWIDKAAAYRNGLVKGIALTGGEPFHDLAYLRKVSDHARKSGLVVSVVTNAFWAATFEQALETLKQVPSIMMISLSTDVHHQRFISVENIRNAVRAADQLGRQCNIAISTDNEQNESFLDTMRQLETFVEPDRIRVAITFPAGRAKKHEKSFNYRTSEEPTISACQMASAPVVFPDGKVMACIGPVLTLSESCPLCLGNLNRESLDELFDRAETNTILHLVRVWGPYKLVSILKEGGYGDLLPKEYIYGSHCDICYKLLSDSRIVPVLASLLEEPSNRNVLAYARMHYLSEPEMVRRAGLDGTESIDPECMLLRQES